MLVVGNEEMAASLLVLLRVFSSCQSRPGGTNRICQQSIESCGHGKRRLFAIGAEQPQTNSALNVSELVVERSNLLAIRLLPILLEMKGLGIGLIISRQQARLVPGGVSKASK